MAEKKDRLPDDAAEYWLFPLVDTSLCQETKRKILLEYIDAYLAFVSSTIVDHIWQKEQFNLTAVTEKDNLPPHLYGKTCYGDNVEDEWLIVYLLFTLTKQFDGLVAKIKDSDEEFMLIEAADHLPKWLEPDTAENRVYIFQGNLHIIPFPQSPAQITTLPSGVPAVQYAVKCVRNYNTATLASTEINNAVRQRFEGLSDRVKKEVHYAHCYIPANLAVVLDTKPSLIAAGVNAFYYRDPIDLKACRTMRYFRPGTRVVSRVKFTRCLYAQLVQQEFQPDKRSGFQMPSTSNPKYLSHDLGMKLAHGFEILCSKCSERQEQNSNGHNLSVDDVRWQRYLKSLIKHGYFKNELEGSILYKQLLEKARQFFSEQIELTNRSDSTSCQGEEVLDILDRITVDIEQLRDAETDLQPPDDDNWLQISPEELDRLMFKSSGLDPTNMAKTGDISDLNKMGDGMKSFVNKVSGVEGAEFPGEDDDIQFDGTGFITQMQKMFEFNDNDDASSSDMSEYGWEESDEDVDDQPPVSKSGKKGKGPVQPTVKDYMNMMDRELSTTDVGKSFERVGGGESTASKPKVNGNGKKSKKSIEEEDDGFKPVDIDMTVVKNMLQSLESQQGLAGPASNILGSMGIKAPAPMAEEDDDTIVPSRSSASREKKKSGPKIPPRPKPTDLPVAPPRHHRSPKKSADSKPPLLVRQESNV
ncbi:protein ecdysoneless homolog [Mytilus californianus]|uniref:protein ecdysoneless homolog n=1 Tax=Mytilus californianus TaxID=6549 RepID=UPI0022486FEC|nr:protein ecdysoneless homolog [Mytilus californianus]